MKGCARIRDPTCIGAPRRLARAGGDAVSNQSATAVRSEHVAETIVAVPMVALVPSAASALPVAVSVAAVRRTGAGAPDTSHNSKLYPTGRVAEPESPVQTRLFMTLVAYKTVNCVASSRPGLRWLASRRLNRPANRQNHFVSSRIVYRRCSRFYSYRRAPVTGGQGHKPTEWRARIYNARHATV